MTALFYILIMATVVTLGLWQQKEIKRLKQMMYEDLCEYDDMVHEKNTEIYDLKKTIKKLSINRDELLNSYLEQYFENSTLRTQCFIYAKSKNVQHKNLNQFSNEEIYEFETDEHFITLTQKEVIQLIDQIKLIK